MWHSSFSEILYHRKKRAAFPCRKAAKIRHKRPKVCAHTHLILFQMTYFLRKIFTIPFEQVSWLAALCALHLLAQMGNGKLLTLPAYSDRIAWDFSPNSLLPSSQKKHSKSYSVVLSQIGISIPVNAGFVKEIAAFLQFFRFKQYPTICGYSHTTWNR